MYHPEITEDPTKIRTMEIHQGDKGWYFTVHQNKVLLYSSLELKDRVKVTELGMEYLDTLNRIDYEDRLQRKEQNHG